MEIGWGIKKIEWREQQRGEKDDDDDVLNFMTWIVIAWMVWSAVKVIDNVLSRARARRTMIETIRMNDGKLDMVREFVWSLVVIKQRKKNPNAEERAKADDDDQLERKRKRQEFGK